jgi:hypothetical protein
MALYIILNLIKLIALFLPLHFFHLIDKHVKHHCPFFHSPFNASLTHWKIKQIVINHSRQILAKLFMMKKLKFSSMQYGYIMKNIKDPSSDKDLSMTLHSLVNSKTVPVQLLVQLPFFLHQVFDNLLSLLQLIIVSWYDRLVFFLQNCYLL